MDEEYFPRSQCVLSNCVKTEDVLEFLEHNILCSSSGPLHLMFLLLSTHLSKCYVFKEASNPP